MRTPKIVLDIHSFMLKRVFFSYPFRTLPVGEGCSGRLARWLTLYGFVCVRSLLVLKLCVKIDWSHDVSDGLPCYWLRFWDWASSDIVARRAPKHPKVDSRLDVIITLKYLSSFGRFKDISQPGKQCFRSWYILVEGDFLSAYEKLWVTVKTDKPWHP